jgi:hypothetical protein
MSSGSCEEVEALNKEYKVYIDGIKAAWLSHHRVRSNNVYETMFPHERERVEGIIRAWGVYVTPFAEAWWKERGYGVVWPADNSKPTQVYKLEDA